MIVHYNSTTILELYLLYTVRKDRLGCESKGDTEYESKWTVRNRVNRKIMRVKSNQEKREW